MNRIEAEQISIEYDNLIEIIKKTFSGDRLNSILNLFNEIGERFALSPASSRVKFHGAFPGGLLIHTLKVIKCAKQVYQLWLENESKVNERITEENVIFVSLLHDIGKIGSLTADMYIEHDDWHIKRGDLYQINPALNNMTHEHRTIWYLNHFGIKMNEDEFIAILTHAGPVDQSNIYYFYPQDLNKLPQTSLLFILHQADAMASRIEHENHFQTKQEQKLSKKLKEINETPNIKSADEVFEDIFK